MLIKLTIPWKALFWLCFLILNAVALSPTHSLPPLELFNWWDKTQHVIGFITLTVLAVLAYQHMHKLHIALCLCGHGVLIEVFQYFGGYRYADWQDAIADAVGVGLGLLLVTFFKSAIITKKFCLNSFRNLA